MHFIIFFILGDFSKSCLLLINLNKDLKVKLNGLVYNSGLIKEGIIDDQSQKQQRDSF